MRRLERKFRKSKSANDKAAYKHQSDIYKSALKEAKSEYLIRTVEDNSNDSNKLFKTINGIMHRSKPNPLPDHEDPHELANKFLDFFQDKIDNIRKNFTDDTIAAFDYDSVTDGDYLSDFEHVSLEDVKKNCD